MTCRLLQELWSKVKKGDELKAKLDEYKKKMLDIHPEIRTAV